MSETNSTSRARSLKPGRDTAVDPTAAPRGEKINPIEQLRWALCRAVDVETYEPASETATANKYLTRLETAHVTASILPGANLGRLVQIDAKAPMVADLAEHVGVDAPNYPTLTRPLVEALLRDQGIDPDRVIEHPLADGGPATELFVKRSYGGRDHLYDAETVDEAGDGEIIRALCGERAPVALVEPFADDSETESVCRNCSRSALADTEGDR